jgi:hypothetical protein
LYGAGDEVERFSFAEAEARFGSLGLSYDNLEPPERNEPAAVKDEDGVYTVVGKALTPAQSYLFDTSGEYHALDEGEFARELRQKEGYEEIISVKGLRADEVKGIGIDPNGGLANGTVYVFDHPGPDKVEVEIHGQECSELASYTRSRDLRLVLDPAKYGFDDDTTISYNALKDVRVEWSGLSVNGRSLHLNERSDSELDRLYSSGNIAVNGLLETVGGIVNGSMEYDTKVLTDALTTIAQEKDLSKEALQRELDTLNEVHAYDPDATMTGVCRHAGLLMRDILLSLELEGDRYLWAQTTGLIEGDVPALHDYTVLVDRETGHWALINSKTTRNEMNLVPRDRLDECGLPFSGIGKNA